MFKKAVTSDACATARRPRRRGGSRLGRAAAVLVAATPVSTAVQVALVETRAGAGADDLTQVGGVEEVSLVSDAPGELTLSWQVPSPAPFNYRVQWARQDLQYLSYQSANETHRGNEYPAGDVTEVTLSGLSEGATYKVQMRARHRDDAGTFNASRWTEEVTATVSTSGGIQQVTLVSDAPGELTLSWQVPSPAPFNYRVQWARQDLQYLSYQSANETHRGNEYPAGDVTEVTLSGLSEGATYKVQMRARHRDDAGTFNASRWTEEVTATVSTTPPLTQQQSDQQQEHSDDPHQDPQQRDDPQDPPLAQQQQQDDQQQGSEPEQSEQSEELGEAEQSEQAGESERVLRYGEIATFELSSDAPGELTISWSTPSPVPDDFRVMWAREDLEWLSYRSLGGGNRGNLYPQGDVTSFTLRNLPEGETYKARMRARYGVTGSGPFATTERSGSLTEQLSVEIAETAPPPGAPRLMGTALGSYGAVTLLWAAPADGGPVQGYRVWRGYGPEDLEVIAEGLDPGTTTYVDTTTPPGQTLHYAVQAYNASGDGPVSGTLSAATPALPEALPEPVLIEYDEVEPLVAAPQRAVETLVSNFANSSVDFEVGAQAATSFSVVNTGRWRFEGVELRMSRRTAAVHNPAVVTVHEDNSGRPGELLWTLSPPTDYLTDADTTLRTYRFTAPDGAELQPGAAYWVVLRPQDTGAAPSVRVTPDFSQDGVGFGIGGTRRSSTTTGDSWSDWATLTSGGFLMAVLGSVIDEPGDRAARGIVDVGGSVRGAFHQTEDVDWFLIQDLKSDTVYVVDVLDRHGDGGTAQISQIEGFYDDGGAALDGDGEDDDDDYQRHRGFNSVTNRANKRAFLSPPSDGDFFVAVELPPNSNGLPWAWYEPHPTAVSIPSTYTVEVREVRAASSDATVLGLDPAVRAITVGESIEGFLHDSFTLGASAYRAASHQVRVDGIEADKKNQFTLVMHEVGYTLLNKVRPYLAVECDVCADGGPLVELTDFGERTSGTWEHIFTKAGAGYVRTTANYEDETIVFGPAAGAPAAYFGSTYTLYAWGEAETATGEPTGGDLPGNDGWRQQLNQHMFTPGFVSADPAADAVSATVDRPGDSDWFRVWMSLHDYNTVTVTQTASAGCLRVRMRQSPRNFHSVPWTVGGSEWSNATRITAVWDPRYDHGGLRIPTSLEGIHYISVDAGPLYTHNTNSTTRCSLDGLSTSERANYTTTHPNTNYTVAFSSHPEVEVSFASETYSVTEGSTVDVTVRLSQVPERPLELTLQAVGGRGAAVGEDFTVPTTVSFTADQTEATFTVDAIEDDDVIPGNLETVTVSFAALPLGVITGHPAETVVWIADND